jgi:hypothetical protein
MATIGESMTPANAEDFLKIAARIPKSVIPIRLFQNFTFGETAYQSSENPTGGRMTHMVHANIAECPGYVMGLRFMVSLKKLEFWTLVLTIQEGRVEDGHTALLGQPVARMTFGDFNEVSIEGMAIGSYFCKINMQELRIPSRLANWLIKIFFKQFQ